MSILGIRIRALREEKEVSQIELAKAINLGNTTISQWESGKRTPDSQSLLKLAEYFDVSVDYLLGNSDVREIKKNRDLPETVAPYLSDGIRELSPEARKEVMDFIEYVRVKYAKKESGEKK